MVFKNIPSKKFGWACSISALILGATSVACGQDPVAKKISEPVFRVSKLATNDSQSGDKITKGSEEKNKTPAPSIKPVLPKLNNAPESVNQPTLNQTPVEKVARAPESIHGRGMQPMTMPTTPANEIPATLPKVADGPTATPMATIKPSNIEQPNAATPIVEKTKVETTAHPLDPALEFAHRGLEQMTANIHDYSAVLVKRESMNGRVGDQEYMKIKVRNPHATNGMKQPFSVYMKFLKPIAGREVIYVEGKNDSKMLVYEPGLATGLLTHKLAPDGMLAMKGNRHPIYEAGLENLVKKLVAVAERDKAAGDCEVEFREGATINGRTCTMIQVTHPEKKAPFDFYQAQVFIDDEYQVPIRYAAYDWPTNGSDPQLLEEYTYLKIELNVGLTDKDFDPANTEYKFPGY